MTSSLETQTSQKREIRNESCRVFTILLPCFLWVVGTGLIFLFFLVLYTLLGFLQKQYFSIWKKRKHFMEETVLLRWILFEIIVNSLGTWSPFCLLGKSLKKERYLPHEPNQIHNSPLLAPNYSCSKAQENASSTKAMLFLNQQFQWNDCRRECTGADVSGNAVICQREKN